MQAIYAGSPSIPCARAPAWTRSTYQSAGGTSVGSVERIEAVADRVQRSRAAGDDVVVVGVVANFYADVHRVRNAVLQLLLCCLQGRQTDRAGSLGSGRAAQSPACRGGRGRELDGDVDRHRDDRDRRLLHGADDGGGHIDELRISGDLLTSDEFLNASAIPEPSTLVLSVLTVLLGAVFSLRRKRFK